MPPPKPKEINPECFACVGTGNLPQVIPEDHLEIEEETFLPDIPIECECYKFYPL